MPDFPQSLEMETHRSTVSKLSSQVASFHRSQTPFRIYHGTTNSTRTSTRTATNSLDVSSLNHVISVSPTNKTCLCEPNVAMEDLLEATFQHGLMPPVVPEFRKITAGGAFSGTAGESSCFKHSFFDRSANWFEMILADGEVVTASATEREDLFLGAAGTFGTLGVTTLFELRLVEAKPYVELTYLPVKSIQHAVDVIEDAMNKDRSGENPIDFLDGIIFSATHGVVMSGKFVSSPPTKLATFHKATDKWFYLHAQSQSLISSQLPAIDTIPLPSYIFRYDRGAFWMGRHAFNYFMTPFNRVTRYLLNSFMNTAIMYHALHRSGMTSTFIIQDMAVPSRRMREFSDWLDDPSTDGGKCGEVYPRWLCPLRPGERGGMNPHAGTSSDSSANGHIPTGALPSNSSSENDKEDFLLNIGLWGPLPPSSSRSSTQSTINRAIEHKLSSLKGMKWLYAQTFYTRAEFWAIYDEKSYVVLRQKYGATGLMDVYGKVGPRVQLQRDGKAGWGGWIWENVWPVRGVYGVLSAIRGGDYLRKGR